MAKTVMNTVCKYDFHGRSDSAKERERERREEKGGVSAFLAPERCVRASQVQIGVARVTSYFKNYESRDPDYYTLGR